MWPRGKREACTLNEVYVVLLTESFDDCAVSGDADVEEVGVGCVETEACLICWSACCVIQPGCEA